MKRVLEFSRAAAIAARLASLAPAAAIAAPPPGANPNSVKVGEEQMHQLRLVPAEMCEFQMKKTAIGQIAFNEDASTVVLTPFSGRVTRLIAKIGDEVKVGDPLFEIDSPEVVQAQTDLIAAVQSLDKAKSQFNLAKRVLDRQTGLLNDRATSQREVDQARTDFTVAENDLGTARGRAESRAQQAARDRRAWRRRSRARREGADHQSAASPSTRRSPAPSFRARSAPASMCAATAPIRCFRFPICRPCG